MKSLIPQPKRSLQRSRLYLGAHLECAAGYYQVRLRDVSSAGALLECSDPPSPGSLVELVLGSAIMDAKVAWRDGSWFGIEFELPFSGNLVEKANAQLKVSAPRTYRREVSERECDRDLIIRL
jgi:hypothetical protein